MLLVLGVVGCGVTTFVVLAGPKKPPPVLPNRSAALFAPKMSEAEGWAAG